jgi:Family of unknown function (DUF5906)
MNKRLKLDDPDFDDFIDFDASTDSMSPPSTPGLSPQRRVRARSLPEDKLMHLLRRILAPCGDTTSVLAPLTHRQVQNDEVVYSLVKQGPARCASGHNHVDVDHFHLALKLNWHQFDEIQVRYFCFGEECEGMVIMQLEGDALLAATECLHEERKGTFAGCGFQDRVIQFNTKHFMCNHGAGYATIMDNGEVVITSKQHFANAYEHLAQVPTKRDKPSIAFTKAWCEHPLKRIYTSVECIPPPLECPRTTYNKWGGFAADKYDGQFEYDESILHNIFEQFKVLTNYDDACYKYVLNWLAHIIQYPGWLSGVGIFITGDQGCGKNIIVDWFGMMILGPALYLSTEKAKLALGPFNHIHSAKLLMNMDEIKSEDGYLFSEDMKALITQPTKYINRKGIDPVREVNCTRILGTSNNRNPIKIPAGEAERRMLVLKASNVKCGDYTWWSTLVKDLEDPRVIWTFKEHLRRRDISKVHWANDRPKTQQYQNMQQTNVYPHIRLLHYIAAVPDMVNVVTWTFDQLFTLQQNFHKEWLGDKAANDLKKVAYGKDLNTVAADKTPGDASLTSGITAHRTSSARMYQIDRAQLLKFLTARYGVNDDAMYLQGVSKGHLTVGWQVLLDENGIWGRTTERGFEALS